MSLKILVGCPEVYGSRYTENQQIWLQKVKHGPVETGLTLPVRSYGMRLAREACGWLGRLGALTTLRGGVLDRLDGQRANQNLW